MSKMTSYHGIQISATNKVSLIAAKTEDELLEQMCNDIHTVLMPNEERNKKIEREWKTVLKQSQYIWIWTWIDKGVFFGLIESDLSPADLATFVLRLHLTDAANQGFVELNERCFSR